MIELEGKYNKAKVFTDNIEEEAVTQIINLLNQEFVSGSKIRIMPDTHAGAGCTIGTTMTITDKIVPNLVGVDIGCGMETVVLKDKHIELSKLDKVIHQNIPAGFSIRKKNHHFVNNIDLRELRCFKHVNIERAELSLGTLGGGNHFIELDKDDEDKYYLVIHSGSRNLGKQAAEYYQKECAKRLESILNDKMKLIALLKSQGRDSEIENELKKMNYIKVDKNLAYATDELFNDYLYDMKIIQNYATLNRKAIAQDIIKLMGLKVEDSFTTIHNYVDTDTMILRKGAISAQLNEKVLIPINMRDGSLICLGKGNPDWNYSAPHGAGRLMSRSRAKESFTLSEFQETMKDIYSTTITRSTLDEAPFAYKDMNEIITNIVDTVELIKIIKPVYNFKASE